GNLPPRPTAADRRRGGEGRLLALRGGPALTGMERLLRPVLITIAITGLILGGGFWLAERPGLASAAWTASTLPVLAALVVEIVTSLRRGDYGLDVVAALSMSAA